MNSTFFSDYELIYTAPGSQLKDHIYERSRAAFRRGDAARDALETVEAVHQRQRAVRQWITKSFGGIPSAEGELHAQTTGRLEHPLFEVEKVIYQARPHHYVAATLYLPRQRPERCPAILFLCGHTDSGRLHPRYQAVCQKLAAAGLVVLAVDPLGQGERLEYYDPESGTSTIPPGVYQHAYAGAQCDLVGENLARYFLHDAMRGVDYLLSRPEVDPERIGVTGNSGGGLQTGLLAMMDDRIAAAAPATYVMSRESYLTTGQAQDAEQIWPGFTAAGFDHEDVLLAAAPKPYCILATTGDFFPIEGTRRTFARCQRIWGLFGETRLEMVEDVSVHSYTPHLAHACVRFFTRHFFGEECGVEAFQPSPWPEAELQSTRSGQVMTEFSDAQFVFDSTRSRVRQLKAERHALPSEMREQRAREWLRERVEAYHDQPPVNPRVMNRRRPLYGLAVDVAYWWALEGVANLGMLFRPHRAAKRLGVTIAVWDDGSNALPRHFDWLLRECYQKQRAVLVLDLSTMGTLTADAISRRSCTAVFGTHHKLADDLVWLGDDLAALHTYEVLRVLEALSAWPELDPEEIALYAHGRYGAFAKLAAAIEPRLGPCHWVEAFTYEEIAGHRYYPFWDIKPVILRNALAYFDLNELKDAATHEAIHHPMV